MPHPKQAANLFLSMFMGDGHVRGLLMLDMPSARENRALLREAVSNGMLAVGKPRKYDGYHIGVSSRA